MTDAITRRRLFPLAAGGLLTGWLGRLSAHASEEPAGKSCILLWMAGGPSHLDTFDLKPDAPADVRGEFRPIDTAVPGIQVSEHFPRFAKLTNHAALLRGMSTAETDHVLASYHLHTGYQKRAGGVVHPGLGAIVSRELGRQDFPLPNYVCVGGGPRHGIQSGFFGPDHQPLNVTTPERGTDFLNPSVEQVAFQRQYDLFRRFDDAFQESRRAESAEAHRTTVERAVRLMNAEQKRAFDLSREPDEARDRYGGGSFGQGCLMARRLVETGVRFVEVLMGDGVGWDTHRDNFPRVRELSAEADVGMSALIDDLDARGLLDSTLVIWMGEFGRTPQIASGGGRNHWARAWSSLLVGGGIRGGQVIGRTDATGSEVVDRPISVADFLASVCTVLGIDYTRVNRVPGIDRPLSVVDTSQPVTLLSELQ